MSHTKTYTIPAPTGPVELRTTHDTPAERVICAIEDCETPDDDVQDAYEGRMSDPLFLCRGCLAREGERCQERSDEAFYGGSGPQTIGEQSEAAWRVKQGLR